MGVSKDQPTSDTTIKFSIPSPHFSQKYLYPAMAKVNIVVVGYVFNQRLGVFDSVLILSQRGCHRAYNGLVTIREKSFQRYCCRKTHAGRLRY